MKTFLVCLLILFTASCKKNEAPVKTVNDIVLTQNPLDVPISTYDTGPFPIQSVLSGNSIYFANWSNTAKAPFFVRYDIASNSFSSPLATSSSLCGCGYKSHLVGDRTTLFYVGNDVTKYTISGNTWTSTDYPATVEDNAGEAGVVLYNGTLYFVGGRTPSTLVKSYTSSQDKWSTVPNYLYPTTSPELAVYKDRIYVLGGQGAKQKMAYFSTITSTWTALKDIPFEVSGNYGNVFSAVLGDYLYLLQGSSVYIYDIVNDTWAANPILLNELPDNGNLFSDGQKLYISGKNKANLPAVTELVVSTR